MSTSVRFAPMTSELLARKGEARPLDFFAASGSSNERRDVVVDLDVPPLLAPARGQPEAGTGHVVAAPQRAADVFEAGGFAAERPQTGRRHSISLKVSESELEKLGLIAVKKHVNRQQLLRLAIDHYLEKLAAEYHSDCRCISAAGGCCGGGLG